MYTREYATRDASAARGAASTGDSNAAPVANANADAACPDGKEVEAGSLRRRLTSGTRSINGRFRLASCFMGRFTTADVTPNATSPLSAARRPKRPPANASTVAMHVHSTDLFALRVRRGSTFSKTGLWRLATLRKSRRSFSWRSALIAGRLYRSAHVLRSLRRCKERYCGRVLSRQTMNTTRMRWLIAALSSVSGTALAHAGGYWAAHGDAHERATALASSGHGYWKTAVLLAFVAAIASVLGQVALSCGDSGRRGRGAEGPFSRASTVWLRLAILQCAAFTFVEVAERLAHGTAPSVLTEPAFWLALPLQLAVAGLAALVLQVAAYIAAASPPISGGTRRRRDVHPCLLERSGRPRTPPWIWTGTGGLRPAWAGMRGVTPRHAIRTRRKSLRHTTLRLTTVVGVLTVAWASAAHGHGDIQRTVPRARSSINSLPHRIVIDFTEPPAPGASVTVRDGCDRDIVKSISIAGTTTTVSLLRGEPGRFAVSYSVVSDIDGHSSRGRYFFHVSGSRNCRRERPGGSEESARGAMTNEPGAFPWPIVLGGTVVLVILAVAIRTAAGRSTE